jgi:Protein of unknown function (DUF2939)
MVTSNDTIQGVGTAVLDRLQRFIRRVMWLSIALVASYVASPFVAVYFLHGAIKHGNISYFEPRVDWDGIRTSLKQSLAERMAENAGKRTRTGILASIRYELVDTFSPMVMDYAIDSKVTPQGFVDYFKPKAASKAEPTLELYRGRWNLSPITPVEAAEISIRPPALPGVDMLKRIDQAKFRSLTALEIDVRDRADNGRRYRATMELKHYQWQLTRVDVLDLGIKHF